MQAKSTGFIAYYRVSTDRQGKSGLGLEAKLPPWGAISRASAASCWPSTPRSRRAGATYSSAEYRLA